MFHGREEGEKSCVPGRGMIVQRTESSSGGCGGGSSRERGGGLRRVDADPTQGAGP